MIFSIILVLGLILWLWIWKTNRPKYIISYLETSTPSLESYKKSEKTRNKYFSHPTGIVNLAKHPEYHRFREVRGTKEYLVEPWKRDGNLYIKEGVTKAVIFEFLKDPDDNLIAVIPCLRTIETIVEDENDNPLLGYRETYLGVSWEGGKKMIKSENLLGIVVYESL